MTSIHPNLLNAHNSIKWSKQLEKQQGYDRIIEWSRLPKVIRLRRGFRLYTYKLEYNDTDDSVYISYADDRFSYECPHRVLMHYEEPTLQRCITKAWRNLAEKRIKVKHA